MCHIATWQWSMLPKGWVPRCSCLFVSKKTQNNAVTSQTVLVIDQKNGYNRALWPHHSIVWYRGVAKLPRGAYGVRTPNFFGHLYQNFNKMMVGRVTAALLHPQNPLLKPFLATPLVSYTSFYFKLLFIVVEANISGLEFTLSHLGKKIWFIFHLATILEMPY